MLRYALVICFLVFSSALRAQTFKNDEERLAHANKLFEEGKYIEAFPHFSNALGNNREDADLNFKFGACQLFANEDKTECLSYLRFASKQAGVDPRVYFFLGKAYHLNYKFKQAEEYYKKFKEKADAKTLKNMNADNHILQVQNGRALLKNLTELVVEDKKESSYEKFQYSYDLSNIGGKILVSQEFESKIDKKLGYRSLIYFPSLGVDYLFYSSYGKTGENGLDLYMMKKTPEGEWGTPSILPESINTPYDDSYGFLHSDGRTFYFCSQGHNSMGGYDVFKSTFDPVNGTFSKPVNLDYKINTPDDDIMFVADKENKNAYFASARATKGGYLDVYKVVMKTFPVENVILAGTFINEIDAADNLATIKVENALTNQEVGVFKPEKDGKYVILLPKAGKYKLVVETPKSEKIHSGLIDIPAEKVMEPLKQEILLVNRTGQEQLIIRNLFDETLADSEDLIAGVLKKLADQEVNSDKFDVSQVIAFNGSNEELLGQADKMAESTQEELEELERRLNGAYAMADKEAKKAKDKASETESAIKALQQMTDPNEKREQTKVVKKLHKDAEAAKLSAVTAANLAKQLEEEKVLKKADANEARDVAERIRMAVETNDAAKGAALLSDMQKKIDEHVFNAAEHRDAYDAAFSKAKERKTAADKALNDAQAFRTKEDEARQKEKLVERELEKAKQNGAAYDHLEQQITDLKEQQAKYHREGDAKFKENAKLQEEATNYQQQAELLAKLYDDIDAGSGTVVEVSQKQTILKQAEDVSTMDQLAANADFVNKILQEESSASFSGITGTPNQPEYDALSEQLKSSENISNPVDRAKAENAVHQNWIEVIDEDVANYTRLAQNESDPIRKRDFENKVVELLALKDEKESQIKTNNKIIEDPSLAVNSSGSTTNNSDSNPSDNNEVRNDIQNESANPTNNSNNSTSNAVVNNTTTNSVDNTGTTNNANNTANNSSSTNELGSEDRKEKYAKLDEELKQASSLTDPLEKAQKTNELNASYVSTLKGEAKSLKQQMDQETDQEKKTEYLFKMNEIFGSMAVKEEEIAKNNEVIRANGGTVPTDVVVSNYDPNKAYQSSPEFKTFTGRLDKEAEKVEGVPFSDLKSPEAKQKITSLAQKIEENRELEKQIAEKENEAVSASGSDQARIDSEANVLKEKLAFNLEAMVPVIKQANKIEFDNNESKIEQLRTSARQNEVVTTQDKNLVAAEHYDELAKNKFKEATQMRKNANVSNEPQEKAMLLQVASQLESEGLGLQEVALDYLRTANETGYTAAHFSNGSPEISNTVRSGSAGTDNDLAVNSNNPNRNNNGSENGGGSENRSSNNNSATNNNTGNETAANNASNNTNQTGVNSDNNSGANNNTGNETAVNNATNNTNETGVNSDNNSGANNNSGNETAANNASNNTNETGVNSDNNSGANNNSGNETAVNNSNNNTNETGVASNNNTGTNNNTGNETAANNASNNTNETGVTSNNNSGANNNSGNETAVNNSNNNTNETGVASNNNSGANNNSGNETTANNASNNTNETGVAANNITGTNNNTGNETTANNASNNTNETGVAANNNSGTNNNSGNEIAANNASNNTNETGVASNNNTGTNNNTGNETTANNASNNTNETGVAANNNTGTNNNTGNETASNNASNNTNETGVASNNIAANNNNSGTSVNNSAVSNPGNVNNTGQAPVQTPRSANLNAPAEVESPYTAPTKSGVAKETVNGITFNPDDKPKTFAVSDVVNVKEIGDYDYENTESQVLLADVREDMNNINNYNYDIETLNQLQDSVDAGEWKKIKKGIAKLEKKKLKSEFAIIENVQKANAIEVGNAKSKSEEAAIVAETVKEKGFAYNQAIVYIETAKKLETDAVILRESAQKEKNKEVKIEKIKEAQAKEMAAAEMYNQSTKLFADAVVEPYNLSKNEMEGAIPANPSQRASEQILEVARQANSRAIELADAAVLARDSANNAKKAEKEAMLVRAGKLEQMALVQESLAQKANAQHKKVKAIEEAIIEEQTLIANLTEQDINVAKSMPEFGSYMLEQPEVSKLNAQIENEVKAQEGFESLAKQQENKAKDLRAQAASSDDLNQKKELIQLADNLEVKARENRKKKEASAAIVENLSATLDEVMEKQNLAVVDLTDETVNVYRGIILAEIEIDGGSLKSMPKAIQPGPISSVGLNFVPPAQLTGDIFKIDPNFVYTDSNPIPVNVTDPKGVVYKIQVGAFRNPIDPVAFKGFAPMSAEKLDGGITRYRVGYFKKFNSADEAKNKVRGMGYADAYVVAFFDGKKISMNEARRLEGNPGQSPAGNNLVDNTESANTNNGNVSNNSNTSSSVSPSVNNSGTSSTNANLISNNAGNNNVNVGDNNVEVELDAIKGVFYTVQVGAYSQPIKQGDILNISPLVKKNINGMYKYTTGVYRELGEAVKRKQVVIEKGVTDAFVVAYQDGERISIQRAAELIKALGESAFAVSEEGNLNLKTAKPVEGLVYRIFLGSYTDGVPQARGQIFMRMKKDGMPIEESEPDENGVQTYFCGKHGLYSQAETMLVDFKTEGVSIAEIVAYKDGKKISLQEAKKLTNED